MQEIRRHLCTGICLQIYFISGYNTVFGELCMELLNNKTSEIIIIPRKGLELISSFFLVSYPLRTSIVTALINLSASALNRLTQTNPITTRKRTWDTLPSTFLRAYIRLLDVSTVTHQSIKSVGSSQLDQVTRLQRYPSAYV